jgi:prepilin-type N-terminal cleavage/methylation domain-containing protein/prepilin-type processing-associated H-X9-DG protein
MYQKEGSGMKKRTAFTMIELLLVLGVLGILLSLLMIGAMRVREAASRMVCASHLKELATACHQHHHRTGGLPNGGAYEGYAGPIETGTWAAPDGTVANTRTWGPDGLPAPDPQQGFGLFYQLLPDLEHADIYLNKDDNVVLSTVLPVLFCPTRRKPMVNFCGFGCTDYAGVIWSRYDYPFQDGPNNRRTLKGAIIPSDGHTVVRFCDIPAGCSNIMLIAERHCPDVSLGEYFVMGGICNDEFGAFTGYGSEGVRESGGGVGPDMQSNWEFGSSHKGVMNAAFCDGSVRTIPFTIDRHVFAMMGNRFGE